MHDDMEEPHEGAAGWEMLQVHLLHVLGIAREKRLLGILPDGPHGHPRAW